MPLMAVVLTPFAAPRGASHLSSSATAHRQLMVGVDPARYGTLYWSAMPQPDQEVHATVGTKLVFKYSSEHDVGLLSSDYDWLNCVTSDYEELASTDQGGGAAGEPANRFAAVVTAVGEYYFTCGQAGHCQAGQKIKVVVTMGSPPPPPASPPPGTPPAPPMAPRHASGPLSLHLALAPAPAPALALALARCEYTFYGTSVNMAARLMTSAANEGVLVDEQTYLDSREQATHYLLTTYY